VPAGQQLGGRGAHDHGRSVRSVNQVFSGCVDPRFEYGAVSADVRIDGAAMSAIGLRKKGFLGSLSMLEPSLKLDLEPYGAGQGFRGHKDLTLSNNRFVALHGFESVGVALVGTAASLRSVRTDRKVRRSAP
jgi:hypothetical protein